MSISGCGHFARSNTEFYAYSRGTLQLCTFIGIGTGGYVPSQVFIKCYIIAHYSICSFKLCPPSQKVYTHRLCTQCVSLHMLVLSISSPPGTFKTAILFLPKRTWVVTCNYTTSYHIKTQELDRCTLLKIYSFVVHFLSVWILNGTL